MAFRPHTVKLKGASQATFAYMPQEQAEEYEQVLLNYEKSKESVQAHDPEMKPAIGVHLNREINRYELVTIFYNPLTKALNFGSLIDAGSIKSRAIDNFKKAAIKLKIV